MPSIPVTNDEAAYIATALQAAVASAKRAQTGKMPQIVEVYKTQEAVLKELESKFLKAANAKHQ